MVVDTCIAEYIVHICIISLRTRVIIRRTPMYALPRDDHLLCFIRAHLPRVYSAHYALI